MKKLLAVGILSLSVLGLANFGMVNAEEESNQEVKQETKEVKTIVRENGWMVIKENKPEYSTIAVKVTKKMFHDKGYYMTENLFDKNDRVVLYDENYPMNKVKVGDRLYITFSNDVVDNVKKFNKGEVTFKIK